MSEGGRIRSAGVQMVLNIKQSLFGSLIKIDAAPSGLSSVFQQDKIKPPVRSESKGKSLKSYKRWKSVCWKQSLCLSPCAKVVGEWHFSLIHCDVLLTLDVMMCTASILNLCAISIDRWDLSLFSSSFTKRCVLPFEPSRVSSSFSRWTSREWLIRACTTGLRTRFRILTSRI